MNTRQRTHSPLLSTVRHFCIGYTSLFLLCALLFPLLAADRVFYKNGSETVFGKYYLLFAAGLGILVLVHCALMLLSARAGKRRFGIHFLESLCRYRFLLSQLVSRDFKTKYKRSVLGVLWSFLNPLLMMSVQYVVFSNIFRYDNIRNYPVYLLCGIVFFNFFNECTSMGLNAIVQNAPLITKVYVPKYIYPLCRVLSSLINLSFSLIPLIIVSSIAGLYPVWVWLLLLFDIACLALFCFGMSLLLSALMVFFRDIQFLWGVLLTVWTYLTPIFYPVDIIPARFLTLYKLNPLYHFVTFAREVILERTSPALVTYGACLCSAVCMLAIGAFCFAKTQKKFVLYL